MEKSTMEKAESAGPVDHPLTPAELLEELTQQSKQLEETLAELGQQLIRQNPDARDIQAQLVTTRRIKQRIERLGGSS